MHANLFSCFNVTVISPKTYSVVDEKMPKELGLEEWSDIASWLGGPGAQNVWDFILGLAV